MELKFVKGPGYTTYNTKEVKEEHKQESEEAEQAEATQEQEEKEEAPVPLVIHVNNILYSIFSNVEEYISNQQIYNSNGLHAHKSYFFNNFKGAISE